MSEPSPIVDLAAARPVRAAGERAGWPSDPVSIEGPDVGRVRLSAHALAGETRAQVYARGCSLSRATVYHGSRHEDARR